MIRVRNGVSPLDAFVRPTTTQRPDLTAVVSLFRCSRFVLERALAEHKRLRESGGDSGLQHVVALSFSPGVTVEGLLLKAMPPPAAQANTT